jgi:hypothetical protein
MVNLVYGETGGVARRTRLEAFVHQVKAYHDRHGRETKPVWASLSGKGVKSNFTK